MSEQNLEALLVIGAGYTGKELARQAVERGISTWGTTRKATTRADLEEVGAHATYWDLAEDDVDDLWEEAPEGRKAAVYSIPTIFEEYVPAEGDEPARHVAPVLEVLERLETLGVERFVYISSTSVYGDHDGEWCDESSERRPTSPYGMMRMEIEDAVMAWEGELDTFVCRAVGIYGPGRTLDKYIERGRYKLVDGGTKPGNRIHRDDLAGICLEIARGHFTEPQDFIATDGTPIQVVELVDWLVENVGLERPEEVTLEEYAEERGPNAAARWSNVCRYRNDRVVDVLDYDYRYPDVITGYSAIFDV